LNASCTTRGLGQLLPLFRLLIVRSSVKASWISRQYNSSAATSSGARPATAAPAACTSASPLRATTSAEVPSAPVRRRNPRRLHLDTSSDADYSRSPKGSRPFQRSAPALAEPRLALI